MRFKCFIYKLFIFIYFFESDFAAGKNLAAEFLKHEDKKIENTVPSYQAKTNLDKFSCLEECLGVS